MVIIQLSKEELDQLIQIAVHRALDHSNHTDSNSNDDQIFSVKQTANYLNLSVASVYGMVQRGTIPVSKRGKRLYFLKSELSAWVRAGRKTVHDNNANFNQPPVLSYNPKNKKENHKRKVK